METLEGFEGIPKEEDSKEWPTQSIQKSRCVKFNSRRLFGDPLGDPSGDPSGDSLGDPLGDSSGILWGFF